jgi:hypothetical protein
MLHTIPSIIPRKITSKSKKICDKFIQHIYDTQLVPKLLAKINSLSNITTWTKLEHKKIDEIDKSFTQILLQAEQATATPTKTFWNKELDNIYTVYTFWTTTIKGFKDNRNVTVQLRSIIETNPTLDMYQGNSNKSPEKQLQYT